MQLETFTYSIDKGWSTKEFPNLDSQKTLILVFAAPEINKNQGPLKELTKQYPNSTIVGCSGSGEISGARILDNCLSVAVAKFDKTPFRTVKFDLSGSSDSMNAGKEIAKKLKTGSFEKRVGKVMFNS